MIARRTGVSIHELAQINRLANPGLIYVGQRLLVPPDGSESGSDERTLAGDASADARPDGGQVYVVQPNDTLARIAARYDVSVWVLAQFNEIANPSVIHAGQSLLIPTTENPTHLPPPFLALEVTPVVAVQGQTVQVWVETDGAASLSGQYDGWDLVFAERGGPGRYGTLIAIPAMASPGPTLIEVKAVQGERQASVRSMLDVRTGSFGFQTIRLPAEKAALLDSERVAQESQLVRETTAQATLPGLWRERFAVPLAGAPSVSAPFGGRRSYNDGPAVGYHSGVDYSIGSGTPVLCPAPGRVVLAETLQVRGNAVILDHGRGVMSGYWHLSQIQVSEGELVERGEVLGLVGSTGLSTGAHLHWEMRVMGIPVDPLQWVREDIR
jgi:murein DD-endopeptidase MepM/ murein hydrolase activator NlpD